MNIKIQCIILILFSICCNGMELQTNLSCENILNHIEINQGYGMDCTVYSNSIETFVNDYKQLYDSLSISCQLHLKSAINKLKLMVDQMVDQKIEEHLKHIDKIRTNLIEIKKDSFLQSAEKLHEKYKDEIAEFRNNLTKTNEENVKLNEIILKQNETLNKLLVTTNKKDGEVLNANNKTIFDQSEMKAAIMNTYDKNLQNLFKTIEIINKFTNNDSILHGYRLLFDEMKINKHEFSAPTTAISYRVFNDFKQMNNSNDDLNYLRTHLPESLKSFPWNQTVYIQNVMVKENIFFDTWINDSPRRLCFSHNTPDLSIASIASNIIPFSNGSYFIIQSQTYNETMYAETEDFAVDKERRRVYMWSIKTEQEMGKWQFEPVQGTKHFKIKNLHWNEYLALDVSIKIPKGGNYNQMLTLRSENCKNDACEWIFLKHSKA